ncbi:MAG: DUF3035 domain-containing protein [Candidatus Pelagibacter sp. TMED286]|nr:MAG: hypothetical protein CNB20_01795 [Pelagibacterales bacterium MED-G43]RPG94746.1 MAG: DUF3035 domain-containing protein [Candidatus Pelagibacter sp. TMED286]|tara:strand:+ start:26 stop:340 length:315 start_codon:yes stop_codon:yes gene_type:complete
MNRLFLTILFLFTVSCQSMGDAKKVLTNQKIKTADEFLVKKKEPLELPPEYNKIPEPGSIEVKEDKKLSENEKIKKILKAPATEDINNKNASSTEKAILNKIRK